MEYAFDFLRYRRPFRTPPRDGPAHEAAREGFLVRLRADGGREAFGEVAPLEAFGTETIDRVEAFLRGLGSRVTTDVLETFPGTLPCCRFALESALVDMEGNWDDGAGLRDRLPVAGLLPAGLDSENRMTGLAEAGYRTLKWKIGAESFEVESDGFRRLRERVPDGVVWRLDANGTLDGKTAMKWARELDGAPVEFLEQPLPPERDADLLSLARDFPVPIALDESVGTLPALFDWAGRGWPGVFVIKPAIAGSPGALRRFVRESGIPVVFSSALETGIGMRHALGTAFACGTEERAVGWGTGLLFEDGGLSSAVGPTVERSRIEAIDTGAIWRRLR